MKRLLNLGDKAKDKITGFEGVIVARTTWLSGCSRMGLQSDVLNKDGLPSEPQWFDDNQLVAVATNKIEEGLHVTGGPRPAPTRNADPRR